MGGDEVHYGRRELCAPRVTPLVHRREHQKLIGNPRYRLCASEEIPLRHRTARGILLAIRPDKLAHSNFHAVQYFVIALQLTVALGILNV
jgi:hypothetical protein